MKSNSEHIVLQPRSTDLSMPPLWFTWRSLLYAIFPISHRAIPAVHDFCFSLFETEVLILITPGRVKRKLRSSH